MTSRTPSVTSGSADNVRGAIFLAFAAFFFTAEVVAVRLMDGRASDGQIVFARAVVQLAAVSAWIALRNPGLLKTRRPGLHLLRGLTSLVSWWLYYRSFQILDLALATILTFTTSLFVVLLAGPVLGEKVGPWRWGMTMLGFLGIAIAILPDLGHGNGDATKAGIAAGLGAALAGTALIFQNRILSRTEPAVTIMFYISVVATLGTLPVMLADNAPLLPEALGLLAFSGGLGTAGMFLTIKAYQVGEVSALAPFPYLRLIFSVVAGMLIFSETPGANTVAGAALIIVAAVVITRRSARR